MLIPQGDWDGISSRTIHIFNCVKRRWRIVKKFILFNHCNRIATTIIGEIAEGDLHGTLDAFNIPVRDGAAR